MEAGRTSQMSGGADLAEDFASGHLRSDLEWSGYGLISRSVPAAMSQHDSGHLVDLAGKGDGGFRGSADRGSDRGGEIDSSMTTPITPGGWCEGTDEFALRQRQAPIRWGDAGVGRRSRGGE